MGETTISTATTTKLLQHGLHYIYIDQTSPPHTNFMSMRVSQIVLNRKNPWSSDGVRNRDEDSQPGNNQPKTM